MDVEHMTSEEQIAKINKHLSLSLSRDAACRSCLKAARKQLTEGGGGCRGLDMLY